MQPQTYYNIHILMYVTLQFVSIIINSSSDKTCQCWH